MWKRYITVSQLEEATEIIAAESISARIVAGATDLMLELEKGGHREVSTLVDISRVNGLNSIHIDDDGWIHLGPMVTHNSVIASSILRKFAAPLVQACWSVGSPQIRNRGTVAGNLITASPANDTITPLMAMGAYLVLTSTNGSRIVSLDEFYTGVRKTLLQPHEVLTDIYFPAIRENQKGIFIKYALRNAQAISLVNIAMVMDFENGFIQNANITLGAVAPTIIHAREAERLLIGKQINDLVIREAADLVQMAAKPITDVRSSAEYRKKIVRVVAKRGLEALSLQETPTIPENPVLLSTSVDPVCLPEQIVHAQTEKIITKINGKSYEFSSGWDKSLLRLLREDAGLIGTKEGCAEGECGACTVILDGCAVMSCLVPAPRAYLAEIQTIEGVSTDGKLDPVQTAFMEEGAVQCGYCTPGFIMSAHKLLEEYPTPSQEQILQSLTGNLCRCTGYYSIISAVEKAAKAVREPEV